MGGADGELGDSGGIRYVKARHATSMGNFGKNITGFAAQSSQTVTFGAQNQSNRDITGNPIKPFGTLGIQSDNPKIQGFQVVEGTRKVDDPHQGDLFERTACRLGQGSRCGRGMAILQDNGAGTENGRRSQNCANIVGVLDLIQNQHEVFAGTGGLKVQFGQGVGLECQTLMDRAGGQTLVNLAAIDRFDGQFRRNTGNFPEVAERVRRCLQGMAMTLTVFEGGGDRVVAINPQVFRGAATTLRAGSRGG